MRKLTTQEFIQKSKIVHGEKYDYSKTDYITARKKVTIICPIHGEFEQKAMSHMIGLECKKCGYDKVSLTLSQSQEEFHTKLCNLKSKYDYSQVKYRASNKKIMIICPIHGRFKQLPYDHLKGKGCPKCNTIISKSEIELQNFVKSFNYNLILNSRKILNGKELDIFIPELKKAIEFNGMYWHYEQRNKHCKPKGYHGMKSNLCKEKNIKLLHIREELWLKDKEKMKKVITKFLTKL
jgi:hypothetical protein